MLYLDSYTSNAFRSKIAVANGIQTKRKNGKSSHSCIRTLWDWSNASKFCKNFLLFCWTTRQLLVMIYLSHYGVKEWCTFVGYLIFLKKIFTSSWARDSSKYLHFFFFAKTFNYWSKRQFTFVQIIFILTRHLHKHYR